MIVISAFAFSTKQLIIAGRSMSFRWVLAGFCFCLACVVIVTTSCVAVVVVLVTALISLRKSA